VVDRARLEIALTVCDGVLWISITLQIQRLSRARVTTVDPRKPRVDLTRSTGSRHSYVTVLQRLGTHTAASHRFDSERLQEFGGRVPLDPRVLEVVVVRPHGKVQREREGEYIDVVRVALADAAFGSR
jgi:hypothetical protein